MEISFPLRSYPVGLKTVGASQPSLLDNHLSTEAREMFYGNAALYMSELKCSPISLKKKKKSCDVRIKERDQYLRIQEKMYSANP